MKKIYTLLLSLTFVGASLAQTVITNSVFPEAGDVLEYGTQVGGLDDFSTDEGEDLTWDFTSLSSTLGADRLDEFVDATEGEAIEMFPEATILLKGDFQSIYYKSTDSLITEVGRTGFDPIAQAVPIETAVTGTSTLRRAPLSFGDTSTEQYGFQLVIPKSSIPDSIIDLLGDGAALISDFRVTVDIENDDTADAWGTATMPDGIGYDVLRLKRVSTTLTTLEARLLGIWTNVTLLPIALPDFIQDLVEPQETTNYIFYTNNEKEEVANISVDSLGTVISTTFSSKLVSSSVDPVKFTSGDIVAFPNPSYGDVRFEFKNMPSDKYRVELYDILGRKMWSETSRRGQKVLDADLTAMRRGTYLYRVFDSKGKKLTTKRLMIVRP